MFQLLAHAPKAFWTVSLVQFFCWFAFLFMWTYTNGTIAKNAFHTPTTTHIRALVYKTADGKEHQITAKYILTQDSTVILSNGSATVAGFTENNRFIPASSLEIIGEKPVVVNSMIATVDGVAQYRFNTPIDLTGRTILINSKDTLQCKAPIELRDYLWTMHGPTRVLTAGIVTRDPNTGERVIEDSKAEVIPDINSAHYMERVELNTESKEYNEAGNWVGILFAVQAVGSVLWAVVLPMFRSRRLSYSLSLVLGAIGFITASFLTDQYMLFISFLLIGCAWAAMLAWPFTILTNSLRGGNIGTYLGLFNGSICLPQIIGALAGGWILSMLGSPDQLAPQSDMMAIAGVSLLIGAACVFIIKEHTDK